MLSQKNNGDLLFWTKKLRLLWAEHVVWTRQFLLSTVNDLKDRAFVTKRLLKNPVDFAVALKPVIGGQRAQKFQNLLTEHLLLAAQIVGALKTGDTTAAKAYEKDWYRNADVIALFLAQANPHWDEKDFQTMLMGHLKLTGDLAAQLLSGQYAASITQYDMILAQAMEMADMMAEGIAKKEE